MVDINYCTIRALTTTVGLPLRVARQIIAYKRKQRRRPAIERLDELWNIPGMTKNMFERLRRHYTFCDCTVSSSHADLTKRPRSDAKRKTSGKGAKHKVNAKRSDEEKSSSLGQTSNENDETEEISQLETANIRKSVESCKQGERLMSRKSKSRANKGKAKSRNSKPRSRKRRVSKPSMKMVSVDQINWNTNSRTRTGAVNSLALKPVSVSTSQSGNKLLVTYMPKLKELDSGGALTRELSLPQASKSARESSPSRIASEIRESSPPTGGSPVPNSPKTPRSRRNRSPGSRNSSTSPKSGKSPKCGSRLSRSPKLRTLKSPKHLSHRYMVNDDVEMTHIDETIGQSPESQTSRKAATSALRKSQSPECSPQRRYTVEMTHGEEAETGLSTADYISDVKQDLPAKRYKSPKKKRVRILEHTKIPEAETALKTYPKSPATRSDYKIKSPKRKRSPSVSSRRTCTPNEYTTAGTTDDELTDDGDQYEMGCQPRQGKERRRRRSRDQRDVQYSNVCEEHFHEDQLVSPMEEQCSTSVLDESRSVEPTTFPTKRDLARYRKQLSRRASPSASARRSAKRSPTRESRHPRQGSPQSTGYCIIS